MNGKYAIVNECDKPHRRLVAEKLKDGTFGYLIRHEEPNYKSYNGMNPERPHFLEDFGFTITKEGNQVFFEKTHESKATYKIGEVRQWQGEHYFSFKIVP